MQKQRAMTKLGEYSRRRERSNSRTHFQSGRIRDGPAFFVQGASTDRWVDGRTILSFVPSPQKLIVWIKGCNLQFGSGWGEFSFFDLISPQTRPYCPPHLLPGCLLVLLLLTTFMALTVLLICCRL